MFKLRSVLLSLAMASLPLFAGCNNSGNLGGNNPTPPPGTFGYYTTNPDLGVVGYPINGTAQVVAKLTPTAGNGLGTTQNIAFDANGRLFVVNQVLSPGFSTISVFTPPLTSTSNATFILTMPIAGCTFGIAFDSANHLWISDCNTHIYEFKGAITASGTLPAPDVTLTAPGGFAFGITFDAAGNLWVALAGSNTIAEYKLPAGGFVTGTAIDHTLTGITKPESLVFDKAGNLYAGGFDPDTVEYLAASVGTPGKTPDVVNPTSIVAPFRGTQMIFDTAGNLYASDCAALGTGHIYVYPTSTMAFSSSLAPFVYTDATIMASFCVAGIAIH